MLCVSRTAVGRRVLDLLIVRTGLPGVMVLQGRFAALQSPLQPRASPRLWCPSSQVPVDSDVCVTRVWTKPALNLHFSALHRLATGPLTNQSGLRSQRCLL